MNIFAVIFAHLYRIAAMHALIIAEEIARASHRIANPSGSLKPLDLESLQKDAWNVGTGMFNFSENNNTTQMASTIIEQYKASMALHKAAANIENTSNHRNPDNG